VFVFGGLLAFFGVAICVYWYLFWKRARRTNVFFADNNYIDGIGGKLKIKPNDPNTYKLRTLKDGTQHLIVKNYFITDEIVGLFSEHSEGISEKNVFMGRCFWWINYPFQP
jgi:hypothetical protein